MTRLLVRKEAQLLGVNNDLIKTEAYWTLAALAPRAPMRRRNVDAFFGCRIDPIRSTSEDRKRQNVKSALVHHANFKFAICWCNGNWQPFRSQGVHFAHKLEIIRSTRTALTYIKLAIDSNRHRIIRQAFDLEYAPAL